MLIHKKCYLLLTSSQRFNAFFRQSKGFPLVHLFMSVYKYDAEILPFLYKSLFFSSIFLHHISHFSFCSPTKTLKHSYRWKLWHFNPKKKLKSIVGWKYRSCCWLLLWEKEKQSQFSQKPGSVQLPVERRWKCFVSELMQRGMRLMSPGDTLILRRKKAQQLMENQKQYNLENNNNLNIEKKKIFSCLFQCKLKNQYINANIEK